MKLCSIQHDEVAYECWTCPVCDALHRAEQLDLQVKQLQEDIEELKIQIEQSKP